MPRESLVARIITLIILTVFVIALGFLFIEVMIGFLLPLFLAVLLTILFRPLHDWILRRLGGRTRLAAAITTLLIMLIVLAPIVYVLLTAAQDAADFLLAPEGPKLDRATFNKLIAGVNERFSLKPEIKADDMFKTLVAQARDWLSPIALKTPGFIGGFLINAFVTVFALYYFLADGKDLVASTTELVPLDSKYQQQLVAQFVDMSRAVATATIVTAVAQGLLATAGYYFAGLEGIVLLLMATTFAAFVPIVGSSLVWVPCSLWLLIRGETSTGIALAIWCLAVALVIDNVVKPMILHGQANLHPLLALLSVLGGVAAMGPLGIFVGPMAVSFLQTGLRMLNLELDSLRKTQARKGK